MEVMVVAIFSELRSESGVMSVSTFKEYLNRHGIQCTIIELWYLLSPYAQSPQFVSSSKFTSFANSLKKLDEHRIYLRSLKRLVCQRALKELTGTRVL